MRFNDRGEAVGVVSGHLRGCFPGEPRCHCDSDDDCYPQEGYVPCVPPSEGGVPVAVGTAAAQGASSSASPSPLSSPPADVAPAARPGTGAVAYTGTFAVTPGLQRARLIVSGTARDVWVYVPSSRAAHPPLIVAFHGTNGDGEGVIEESGARALADAEGVIVAAPTARWFGIEGSDYDHPQGNGTYWETRSSDIDRNADLVLVRAILTESERRLHVDGNRVYVLGHSNGGFMALLTAVALRDRVAAFAENSAGMVTCASRPVCTFQGRALSCAELSREAGWCTCDTASHPAAIPRTGRRAPGYLSHGVQDPMVSVYYTCALAAHLTAAGVPVETHLWEGGHHLGASFARRAWHFFTRHPLR